MATRKTASTSATSRTASKAAKPGANVKPVAKKAAAKPAAKAKVPVKKAAAAKPVARPVKPVAAGKPAAAKKPLVSRSSAAGGKPVAVKAPAAKAARPAIKKTGGPVRSAAARKRAAQVAAMDLAQLRAGIEAAFEARADLTAAQLKDVAPLVNRVVDGLENGSFRVAEPRPEGGWQVNEWLKKAVLLYFRINDMTVTPASPAPYWDKVEARFAGYTARQFREAGVRVVPGAIARRGSYFGRDVVLMPSFTNIGAHVGEGTMVDTWATVGSCAQIGKGCHLSGGAGIGGVLEPLQASPTIIEDHCFIGARSEVVEGVVIGHHSVIGMGVFIGQSTRIYNRATGEISYGYVPPYSVVVSGSLPAKDGSHSLYCAVIVKQVDEKTRAETSVNDLLRGLAE